MFSARTSSDREKVTVVTDFELSGPENPINRKRHRIPTAFASMQPGSHQVSEAGGLVKVDVIRAPAGPESKEPVSTSR
jgi:hypothetical protein